MTLEHSLTSYAKINSKWFKHLNIRQDTNNIGKTLSDINHRNIFLNYSPKAKKKKEKETKGT